MKNLKKLVFMGTVILALVSCGKENESGGGGSSSDSSSVGSTQSVNYSSYTEFRDAFKAKSLKSGLSTGDTVYHIGPAFGGNNFNEFDFDFDVDFNACGYFLWIEIGDCDNYNNSSINLANYVEKGELKTITSVSSDKIKYDLATSINSSGNDFNYTAKTYDKNDSFYELIINDSNKSREKTLVNPASVVVNNGTIRADYVEYFFKDGTYRGYVVSNQLPLIANPIAIVEGNSLSTNRNITGALSIFDEMTVQGISMEAHGLYRDTNLSLKEYRLGTLRFNVQ